MRKSIQMALRLKNSEEGFALIAAIMACLILLALGMLVIGLSTQDLRVSAHIVGDKRAIAAAVEGVHNFTQQFAPFSSASPTTPVTVNRPDGRSSYTIIYPAAIPPRGPEYIEIPGGGFAIGGGTAKFLARRYIIDVVGRSTEYNTQTQIGMGVAYGPVPGPGPYQ